ncbi:MAG: hypothetical protein IT379_19315 [Deltaproteobacteria bacterium]|nr:hypothetical protein [Deltaproteobacteria bacterium]
MTLGVRCLSIASLVILVGCGDDQAQGGDQAHTAVGTLTGAPETFVGFVSDASAVTGYVCDGVRIGSWFQGPLADGRFEIVAAGGRLTGSVGAGGAVEGELVDAATMVGVTFTASTIARGTSGLWNGGTEIDGTDVTAGVIVRDDGQQRGIISTRPSGVMAEPMIMPSPMIMPDPMGVTSVTTAAGALQITQIVSPRDPIVSPR